MEQSESGFLNSCILRSIIMSTAPRDFIADDAFLSPMTSARAAARAAKPALESHRKQTYTVGKRKLNVIAPSHAGGADEDIRAAPPCDLELAHVYGYNGRRSRNNAFYLGDGVECVYNIARLCVVLGTRSEIESIKSTGHFPAKMTSLKFMFID